MLSKPMLLAVALSAVAVVTMMGLGLPRGHGMTFAYAWSVQYSAAVTWTDPLPRYLPDLLAGFGGHDFFFYAPLPYWAIAVLIEPACFGCVPSTKLLLGVALVLVASGFAMFAFLRSFFQIRPALIGAAVYALMPYHLLVDWYLRQAIGEFTTYAFIPLVALGMERVRRRTAGGWIMSVGIAGTALSHLPTTLLAGHIFGILALLFAALDQGGTAARLGLLARFVGFALLGLALPAVYWLPAVLLLDSVSPDVLFSQHFEAWRWLLGRSELPPNHVFAWLVLVAFLAVVPLLLNAVRLARGALLVWIVVPVALAVVLNTALAEPIWRHWIISKVQFPWRAMTLVDFSAGIAVAALAARVPGRIERLGLAASFAVLVSASAYLAANVRFAPPGTTPEQNYRSWFAAAEYFSPEMTEVMHTRLGMDALGHFDQGAILLEIESMAAEFTAAHGTGGVLVRAPRSLTVTAPRGAERISVPVQYWALWRAETAFGTALATRPNPEFGTLDIMPPAEGFDGAPLTLALPLQPSEWAGFSVSLAALLALVALIRAEGRPRGPFRQH